MKSLKPRLLTAAIGIPGVLLVIIFSELWHPLVGIIVGLASVLMVGELLYAKRLLACIPLAAVCMLYTLLMPIVVTSGALAYIITYLFLLLGFAVFLIYYKRLKFFSLAYAMFGTTLITFGMSAVPIACCTNGLSVSFFFVLIFQFLILDKNEVRVNFGALIVIAVLDSVLSILGDLGFSLIKRNLNIKDYGSIFPGHGGMLDRCDSIIFTAPMVVVLSQFMPFLERLV